MKAMQPWVLGCGTLVAVARGNGEMVWLDSVVALEEGRSPSRVDRLDRPAGEPAGWSRARRSPAGAAPWRGTLGYARFLLAAGSGRGRELERTFTEFGWAFLLSIAFMCVVLAAQSLSLVLTLVVIPVAYSIFDDLASLLNRVARPK